MCWDTVQSKEFDQSGERTIIMQTRRISGLLCNLFRLLGCYLLVRIHSVHTSPINTLVLFQPCNKPTLPSARVWGGKNSSCSSLCPNATCSPFMPPRKYQAHPEISIPRLICTCKCQLLQHGPAHRAPKSTALGVSCSPAAFSSPLMQRRPRVLLLSQCSWPGRRESSRSV